ncbi:hypothetical protein QBC46DRAFT_27725 [Diplogelasinospora grovesii]|uniref:Fibroin-3 related protein n=1 Tax=Diplogelasinospora grovesii TaxID=303347 RepID=A0AAN6S8G3_9PEZI|nr:hypothetical protein QBC46DRAFT_27725 [Diplogelasinospora grovesii]
MPAIDAAMERSLRDGFVDLLAASLRPVMGRRDIQGQITDVKTAFSSWDNCMQASFCKWPVIAVIIIGGLIIFSIIWCIVRCACCGLSCCCECFQCLKCCGNCCGCCDPPRGNRAKYLDEPFIPPHHDHGYKAQPPMDPSFSRAPTYPVAAASRPAAAEPPQYAEFEVSKKGHEDALPEMPTWENAGSKKIALEEEAVELSQLKKPEASASSVGPNVPLMTGASATPGFVSPSHSPVNRSPYGPPAVAATGPGGYSAAGSGANGYFPPGGVADDPYAQNAQDYHQTGGAYGQAANLAAGQGYGMAGAAMGPGRRSPAGYGGPGAGYGQGRGYPPPGPARQGSHDNYGIARQGSFDTYGTPGSQGYGQGGQGYGMGPRRSPRDMQGGGGYGPDRMRSPAPQTDYSQGNYHQGDYQHDDYHQQADYGAPAYDNRPNGPGRQYSTDSTRPLKDPHPQQEFVAELPAASASTGLQNTGGFDFNSGYSRPGTAHDNGYNNSSTANSGSHGGRGQPNASATQQQQQQHTGPAGYPGYKPYQPPSPVQEGWSGV